MAIIPAIPLAIEAVTKIIDRIFPDKEAADKAKLELFKLQQEGALAELAAETSIAEKQADINIAESAIDNLFRNGWRPAVGWICAMGLSYQFIARPTMNFLLALLGVQAEMGPLEIETLMTLLFGMLGLGWFRSQEKLGGVSR